MEKKEYRRLFIMRKDLHMGAGKLAAQVSHCAEAYWTNLIRNSMSSDKHYMIDDKNNINIPLELNREIYENYICDRFVKTICSAKNLNDLMKAKTKALELGLKEGEDFGLINDCCLTDLQPEFIDENGIGRCTTGIWFKPLPTEVAHQISKKYQLYRD